MSRQDAPANSSRLLLLSLCDFLRQALANYEFPDSDGKPRDCRVFLYGLPDAQDSETYPFVIVRWAEGEIVSDPDAKTVLTDTVLLILGVHSPKSPEQAGILLAELIDVLRRSLWKLRLLASRFELVEPLRCQIVEPQRQQHRFHLATMETVWNYTWPPKNLAEAGISQMKNVRPVASYSAPELAGLTNTEELS